MRPWEKEVPIEVAEGLRKYGRNTSSNLLERLEGELLRPLTSTAELRGIARSYGKRYKVPIKVTSGDDDIWDSHPHVDAVHSYGNGKSVIYLHPVLKYYPKSYIRGVILHELDHREVERRWEKIL